MDDDRYESLSVTRLGTTIIGSRLIIYDEIDSTNERALRLDEDGAVVVADRQTAGRGRHGRAWHSAALKGLWFTVVLKGTPEGLAFAVPLAVRDAIAPITPVHVKWPNDVMANRKKLCGILVEQRGDTIAVGIGLNVNHAREDFPEELVDIATSLFIETGKTYKRSNILREILLSLDARVTQIRQTGSAAMRDEWSDACDIIGKRVQVRDVSGVVTAVDDEGGLVVDTDGRMHHIVFGDVVEVEPA